MAQQQGGVGTTQARVITHITAVLFGLTGILGELIDASAMSITAGRAVFAFVALLPLIMLGRSRKARFPSSSHGRWAIAFSGVFLAIHWVTFFISIKMSGVAIATLGFASFPAFITLFEGFLFKEHTSRADWLAVVFVSFGLVLVVPHFSLASTDTLGFAWALLSGLTFALFTLSNRKAVSGLSSMAVAGFENALVGLLTLPWLLGEISRLRPLDWLWLGVLGVLCTGLSHAMLAASLRTLNARTVGIVIALEPVYAIVFAAILFAQYPSVRMISGGVVIVLTIMFAAKYSRRNASVH